MQKIGDITNTATPEGEFTNGNVAGGVQPTLLEATWHNTVQRELCNVVSGGGFELDPNDDGQVLKSINKLISGKIPNGFILSVNNKKPDSKGNVTLTPSDVGALPNSGALLSSIFDIDSSNIYAAMGAAGNPPTTGLPSNSGNTRFSVFANKIYTGQYWATLISRDQNYTGLVDTSKKTVTWTQVYNTANKPTASDVDAVSASQGGTFQKKVQFTQGLKLQDSDYLAGIEYGSDAASFSGSNLLLKSWYGIGFYSNYPDSGELGIMGYVNVRLGRLEMKEQIIPGNYANFDARYSSLGQAYTKNESDARFNLKNTASKNTNGWHKDSSTGIIIQFGSGNYTNGSRITFPTAFPNACLSVTGNDTGTGIVKVSLGARNTTGFTMYSEQSTVSLNWIAIGY